VDDLTLIIKLRSSLLTRGGISTVYVTLTGTDPFFWVASRPAAYLLQNARSAANNKIKDQLRQEMTQMSRVKSFCFCCWKKNHFFGSLSYFLRNCAENQKTFCRSFWKRENQTNEKTFQTYFV